MQTLIIDTDIGNDIDDALAVAFALKRPELQVLGITTVRGPVEDKARLARKIVRLSGARGVVVAAGYEAPLAAWSARQRATYLADPGGVTGTSQCAAVAETDPEYGAAVWKDAPGFIIDAVSASPGAVGLVTIGPLTNVAAALQRRPAVAPQIPWIAMMGGELAVHRVEHNIACDPVAADIVFSSGVPMFLGTWSVTRRVVLMPEDCDRIRGARSPLCRALGEMIDLWWPHKGGKPGPVMYDLAPVLWAFQPERFTTEAKRVLVESAGDVAAGFTRAVPGEPTMEVTVDMDADGAHELLMETLLAPEPAPPAASD